LKEEARPLKEKACCGNRLKKKARSNQKTAKEYLSAKRGKQEFPEVARYRSKLETTRAAVERGGNAHIGAHSGEIVQGKEEGNATEC